MYAEQQPALTTDTMVLRCRKLRHHGQPLSLDSGVINVAYASEGPAVTYIACVRATVLADITFLGTLPTGLFGRVHSIFAIRFAQGSLSPLPMGAVFLCESGGAIIRTCEIRHVFYIACERGGFRVYVTPCLQSQLRRSWAKFWFVLWP